MNRKTRLTLAYLGIIMAISIFFSALIYNISIGETNRGLLFQQRELRPNLYFVRPDDLDKARNTQLSSYRGRVISRLVLLNIGMLVLGTALSYLLARRHLEPLEQSLEAQARFTSDAAHELRTPLTAIKTETEVGLRDKHLNITDAKALLSSNLEEVAKLEILTNALLRLAKNGGEPDKSTWQNISLPELVSQAVERAQPEADKAKIEIKSDVASVKITGDRDQLAEMLVVLLDNAVKYGRPDSKVSITSGVKDGRVIIKMTDHGIGIKQSDLQHIFERFYRADQSRNKTIVPGFGLGLSLAKQIAEAHDGDITVSSRAGKGSTFSVSLPAVT